ncbi:LysR family substrate-binding domain-containing protein [Microbacterium atlanticum]|uniref:LysR family substrate-binding domain-containing protein n=1 Tax=Microbacterium atlanticum TaxID=2782168 RepID=UPI001E3F4C4A|nr:LysR family substrate-binding domain-containing protein [Microbacterium atlanticum]
MELTRLGEEFLVASRAVLDADDDMQSWLTRTMGTGGSIRVGLVAGGMFDLGSQVLATLRAERPDLEITLVTVPFGGVIPHILNGQADVVVTAAPFTSAPDAGVRSAHIRDSRRVLVVSREHPLAKRPAVVLSDIANETFVVPTGVDAETLAWWVIDPRPDGTVPKQVAVGPDFEGILAAVGAGLGVNITAAEAQLAYDRADLRYIPITDARPSQIVAVFAAGRRDPLLRSFIAAARAFGDPPQTSASKRRA